ncbi:endothelin-converting enzyme homolog [Saccoglossus kowalevskii]
MLASGLGSKRGITDRHGLVTRSLQLHSGDAMDRKYGALPNKNVLTARIEPNTVTSRDLDAYCDTEHCQHTVLYFLVSVAAVMFSRMNTNVDPCDDFYEYSCGRWIRNEIIQPQHQTSDIMLKTYGKVAGQLKVLMENSVDNKIPIIKEVKKYYMSCIDTDTTDKRDFQPLIVLLESLGGWPLFGERPGGFWEESTFDLAALMAHINRIMNQGFIVSTYVSVDDKNASRYVLWLDQGELVLPGKTFYLGSIQNNKFLHSYHDTIRTVALMLGAEVGQLETQISDILTFEQELARLTQTRDERRNSRALYNIMTIGELQQRVPEINWLQYYKGLNAKWSFIDESQEVVLTSPHYVKEAIRIATDDVNPRTVANYMIWRVVLKVISHLSTRFRQVSDKSREMFITPEDDSDDSDNTYYPDSTWRRCVDEISKELDMATGRMYIDAYYNNSDDDIKTVNTMVTYLEDAFIAMVSETDWMDKQTKNTAIDKAIAIHRQIGYPKWLKNDEKLQKYYDDLSFSRYEYFENYLRYLAWNTRREFDQLGRKPVNDWAFGPANVNAFYAFRNKITVPAGIMQPPFYHKTSPQYLNYGGIGMVIGHELTHGFDDKGHLYDKNGLLQKSWWSNETEAKFKQKSQCIVDQYSQYIMKECNMTVNGLQTKGENIADNGGVKEAYNAYRNWRQKNGVIEPTLRLPAVNLTQDQLFFLNYAQIWCSVFTAEGARQKILTRRHSPGEYRVIGALSNSPDFSRVYGCPTGTRMNPANKCQVW